MNKGGQVTVFIIIALVIVGSVVAYIILREPTTGNNIPKEFENIESYYLSCLGEIAEEGIITLGDKGGYIEDPEFKPGNALEPLSNKLNFFGIGIPYWLYIKDNKIMEQIPEKNYLEEQLGNYIIERIKYCDFNTYTEGGYFIQRNEPKIEINIDLENIKVSLEEKIVYGYGEETTTIKNHEIQIETEMGRMYEKAKEIQNYEKESMFLEEYAIDILRLYAPVDGTEITCAPKIWKENEIYEKLKSGVEINMQEITFLGEVNPENNARGEEAEKYFTIKDIDSEGLNINFMYSPNWLMQMEIQPSEDGILIAEPVGNQQGLGILGFCYVTYHYVYDFSYPVMIQIINERGEIFQYPTQVIIKRNNPRESLPLEFEDLDTETLDVCKYDVKDIEINTYDSNLNPVPAKISFSCMGSGCELGNTELNTEGNSVLRIKAPQCVNAIIIAEAEGYEKAKYQMSTNSDKVANIFMEKLYEKNVDIEYKDTEKTIEEKTIIYIKNLDDNKVRIISWPEQKTVELSEGNYEITAQVIGDTEIILPASKEIKCVEVQKPGIMNFFGIESTKEECFDIKIPEQKISNTIKAGGKQKQYITESELITSNNIKISIKDFTTPKTIEEIQKINVQIDTEPIGITLY